MQVRAFLKSIRTDWLLWLSILVFLLAVVITSCGDDTDAMRQREGIYRLVDVEFTASEGADGMSLVFEDVNTHQRFNIDSGALDDTDDNEKKLLRYLGYLGCFKHPEDKNQIEEAPCG